MSNHLQADSIFFERGGKSILKGAWMLAETGSITALFGRNGSGKSSLLNIIYGSVKADHGTTRINHQFLKTPYIHPELLRYLPAYSITPKQFSVQRALDDFSLTPDELLQHFPGFAGRTKEPMGHLSSGERRLIELFLFIMSRSAFVMLDEPFLYLSPINAEQILSLINLQKKYTGFIIADHHHQLLYPNADKTIVIVNGQTHQVKTAEDLVRHGYLSMA